MTPVSDVLTRVVKKALAEVEARALPVFTFAIHHDRESHAVAVFVDTEENSRKTVQRINQYHAQRFLEAIREGNLKAAEPWQANVGRSLSLRDFEAVDLARTNLRSTKADKAFYRSMVRAVVAQHDAIRALSPDPERTLLASSGPRAPVALVWALP